MLGPPSSASELIGARGGFWTKALRVLRDALGQIGNSFLNTPVYFWIYIGVLLYVTQKLTFRQGLLRKRCQIGRRSVHITAAEEEIARDVIDLDKIDETFRDVGGLEEVKQMLTEHVIWPFKRPELFSGRTVRSHPKGVLLYGPPGTGKTLLARALSKELGCSFINVKVESIFSKWVGDTERNASAVFTLAEKIAPCVIFVDEIDALLGARNLQDSTPHTHAKTIFMTSWDGLEKSSNSTSRIIVIGATNRSLIIDGAIRRRMPLQIEVPPPNLSAREKILRIVLKHDLETNPHKDGIIQYVAIKTTGYTGSDLTELCKAAALLPLREMSSNGDYNNIEGELPELTQKHFDEAMRRIKPTT
ncbi:unnamed protein product [Phytomonas sp. Hart1]|nr:unnamed protein product [Phytomonas sp. Hart1]|eukprot:CCW71943.1 unnamed protein product [Phytomonas sp. isolate Hart1]